MQLVLLRCCLQDQGLNELLGYYCCLYDQGVTVQLVYTVYKYYYPAVYKIKVLLCNLYTLLFMRCCLESYGVIIQQTLLFRKLWCYHTANTAV